MKKFAPPPTKFGGQGVGQPKANGASRPHSKFDVAAPAQFKPGAPPPAAAVPAPPPPAIIRPPSVPAIRGLAGKNGTAQAPSGAPRPAFAPAQPVRGATAIQAMQGSGFNSTTSYSGQIYGIYYNPQFDTDGPVTINDLSIDQCLYVGKTVIKNVGDRFIQHTNEDDDMPWYIHNCSDDAYAANNDDYWEYVPRQLWDMKNVTAFDVAAAEQYYMQIAADAGANLRNKVNALSMGKFNSFKSKKKIFTTKKEYGTWEPENLSKILKKLSKDRDRDGIY